MIQMTILSMAEHTTSKPFLAQMTQCKQNSCLMVPIIVGKGKEKVIQGETWQE